VAGAGAAWARRCEEWSVDNGVSTIVLHDRARVTLAMLLDVVSPCCQVPEKIVSCMSCGRQEAGGVDGVRHHVHGRRLVWDERVVRRHAAGSRKQEVLMWLDELSDP
jgi:hypothetical protein